MNKLEALPFAPDQPAREQALDASRSILVQAPAGSGKTDLLTRRFLRLLATVDEPGEVVAITFTIAAAAEMRNRILSELEKAAAPGASSKAEDEFSMSTLAGRALEHSRARGWELLDLPAQLRISTIDSFCREIALQQPLLTGVSSDLQISEQPAELYRRAARLTLEGIGGNDALLSSAIEDLLLWRDNGWKDMEDLLVGMLGQRDRWMYGFVLNREKDWEALRGRLERPFANAVREAFNELEPLLVQIPGVHKEILELARYACEEPGISSPWKLAKRVEMPTGPFTEFSSLDDAYDAFLALAEMTLTTKGKLRERVGSRNGFPRGPRVPKGFAKVSTEVLERQVGHVPSNRKDEKKAQMLDLLRRMSRVDGLESALVTVCSLPPAHYTDEDWAIVRACFTLLRHAAGQLRTVFAEAGMVDYIEVAQIAQRVLEGENGQPSEATLAGAERIRHLLVDEFQDTSRRQHQLLASLVGAWPDSSGRSVFVVGDPMQSIYFFRDADAELFPRVKNLGLEIPESNSLLFDFVGLRANFRTQPGLVKQLNEVFEKVFEANDGSGVTFSAAKPARKAVTGLGELLTLHLNFVPQTKRGKAGNPSAMQERDDAAQEREEAHEAQTDEIVALIRSHMERIEKARACGERYRIAVLGRARTALTPIAAALHDASIPFRAVELEQLKDRPEVLDALSLARALLNPQDRVAWLGLLRAPWCGLGLDDLHKLTSADDETVLERPVPELLTERHNLLSLEAQRAAARVLNALDYAPKLRAALPTATLGTLLQQVWLSLGGASCVDATARANLDLFWSCLDSLPEGEQDVLGTALDAALERLTALPDPAASSECGVQLMTIHKSKGLEFEAVIVPDLQAGGGKNRSKLLSWLERGIAQPDESGNITEFLVAPIQSKGADRGTAKEWVDHVRSEREQQESRRILYVAATRAREELHFFARPAYKDESGNLSLVEPKGSLLATAWPALENEIRAHFQGWSNERKERDTETFTVEAIAASSGSSLTIMPARVRPTPLRRLPAGFELSRSGDTSGIATEEIVGMGASRLYERHEGGLLSRAFGSAVHKLLEEMAQLRSTHDWSATRDVLRQLRPRIIAQVRASGVSGLEAESIAKRAFESALRASEEHYGQWILSPHAGAASEAAWAGIVAGNLRTVRVDRVFRAGLEPLIEGDDAWWIVDYKTAHADELDPSEALPQLRRLFAPQLEVYAAVLRNLHGIGTRLRAGLYYPRMSLLDWWEIGE